MQKWWLFEVFAFNLVMFWCEITLKCQYLTRKLDF